MQIGVVSDTHLHKPSDELWRMVRDVFAGASMVLHAGDLTEMAVLDAFRDKEVHAVCGNMDGYQVAGSLPAKKIVEVRDFRIGLIHGWGARGDLEDRIVGEFEEVDCIVYGHAHRAANHVRNGVLLFNPGAFSGPQPSVGILTLGEGITGRIVRL